jgi:hypothetical protein
MWRIGEKPGKITRVFRTLPTGIVLYTGENVLPFGTDLRAVPIAAPRA